MRLLQILNSRKSAAHRYLQITSKSASHWRKLVKVNFIIINFFLPLTSIYYYNRVVCKAHNCTLGKTEHSNLPHYNPFFEVSRRSLRTPETTFPSFSELFPSVKPFFSLFPLAAVCLNLLTNVSGLGGVEQIFLNLLKVYIMSGENRTQNYNLICRIIMGPFLRAAGKVKENLLNRIVLARQGENQLSGVRRLQRGLSSVSFHYYQSRGFPQNNANFIENNKELPNHILYGIIGELKYRLLYMSLVIISLLGLIYLNLGLYIEFQGSYYLSYYQFIDFNWYEGIKELNQSVVFKPSRDLGFPLSAKLDVLNKSEIAAQFLYPKQDVARFSMEYQSSVPGLTTPFDKSAIGKSSTRFAEVRPLPQPANDSIEQVSRSFGAIATKFPKESFTRLHSTVFPVELWDNNKLITIEIDEFSNKFISIVSYFSGQIKLFLDFSGNQGYVVLEKQSYSQQLLLSIYMMFLFYQLIALLGYHCFCFLGPATLKQSRLKLFQGLQILLTMLLLHFLILPYAITIYEEFLIESLDSELFFSTSFNLLNSWVYCFYFLLITIVLFLLFFSYGYSLFYIIHNKKKKF